MNQGTSRREFLGKLAVKHEVFCFVGVFRIVITGNGRVELGHRRLTVGFLRV